MSISITVDVSAIVDGQGIDAADVLTPIANLKLAIENMLNGVQAFGRISLGAAEALTISSGGAITTTQSHVKVDTFGAAATDDLDTINSAAEGRLLLIRPTDTTHTVVLKHGTGNIKTADGLDFSLDSTEKWAWLFNTGTYWILLSSGGGTTTTGISYSDLLKVQVFS